ncbi:MAG: hypothetical protein HPY76_10150 [Anaerolineae bacterium]|nr:hypothetical protein [Anaerolineae bacterium]
MRPKIALLVMILTAGLAGCRAATVTPSPLPSASSTPPPTPTASPSPTPPLSFSRPLVLAATEAGVWLLDPERGEPQQVFDQPPLQPERLGQAVSANGRYAAFLVQPQAGAVPELVILGLPHGNLTARIPLARVDDRSDAQLGRLLVDSQALLWSPDGAWLGFAAALDGETLDIYAWTPGGGEAVQLSDQPGDELPLAWSLDSRWLVAANPASDSGYALAVNPATLARRALGEEDAHPAGVLGWLDEDVMLAYDISAACGAARLRSIALESGRETLQADHCFDSGAFAPGDRAVLLAVSAESLADCTCGEREVEAGVWMIKNGLGLDELVSAGDVRDASWRQDAGIFTVEREGSYAGFTLDGAPVTLPPDLNTILPVASPASGWFAWAGADDPIGLWVGSPTHAIFQADPSPAGNPAWSPDGKLLVYSSGSRLMGAEAPDFTPSLMWDAGAVVLSLIWIWA